MDTSQKFGAVASQLAVKGWLTPAETNQAALVDKEAQYTVKRDIATYSKLKRILARMLNENRVNAMSDEDFASFQRSITSYLDRALTTPACRLKEAGHAHTPDCFYTMREAEKEDMLMHAYWCKFSAGAAGAEAGAGAVPCPPFQDIMGILLSAMANHTLAHVTGTVAVTSKRDQQFVRALLQRGARASLNEGVAATASALVRALQGVTNQPLAVDFARQHMVKPLVSIDSFAAPALAAAAPAAAGGGGGGAAAGAAGPALAADEEVQWASRASMARFAGAILPSVHFDFLNVFMEAFEPQDKRGAFQALVDALGASIREEAEQARVPQFSFNLQNKVTMPLAFLHLLAAAHDIDASLITIECSVVQTLMDAIVSADSLLKFSAMNDGAYEALFMRGRLLDTESFIYDLLAALRLLAQFHVTTKIVDARTLQKLVRLTTFGNDTRTAYDHIELVMKRYRRQLDAVVALLLQKFMDVKEPNVMILPALAEDYARITQRMATNHYNLIKDKYFETYLSWAVSNGLTHTVRELLALPAVDPMDEIHASVPRAFRAKYGKTLGLLRKAAAYPEIVEELNKAVTRRVLILLLNSATKEDARRIKSRQAAFQYDTPPLSQQVEHAFATLENIARFNARPEVLNAQPELLAAAIPVPDGTFTSFVQLMEQRAKTLPRRGFLF